MMATHEARLIGIAIDCPLKAAYEFAHLPKHFPKWAAGMSSSLDGDGDEWRADTPAGEATIRFTPPNDFGVLDHWVQLQGKPLVHIPFRLIENGTGTQAVFTLYRQPDMSDEDFDRDTVMVEQDLARLKALLESGQPGRDAS